MMSAQEKSKRPPIGRKKEAPEPDVLVGIDIGTSFTKVAYTIRNSKGYGDIRMIQNWAGSGYNENETKCLATILAFKKGTRLSGEGPEFFGKLASERRQDENLDIYEWFKEYFPGDVPSRGSSGSTNANTTQTTNPSPPAAASTDTMNLYTHFLAQLYAAIEKEISSELEKNKESPPWMDAHIDFIFSVPATWNRVHETLGRIASRFEEVAKRASFDENANHRVCITLTEPEAAVMYHVATKRSEFPKNKIQTILLVDSGGGTTDLCLVQVDNTQSTKLSIDRMTAPVGENIGSTHIDRKFEEFVKQRLQELSDQINPSQDWDIDQLSRVMTYNGRFEIQKRNLNSERAASSDIFTLKGPDLSTYEDLEDGPLVDNQKIRFTYHELAGLFNEIIDDSNVTINGREETLDGIKTLILRAMDQIRIDERPAIDTILLSGGLGQSAYLKGRIEKALVGAKIPKVITVEDPQLCVSQGLLHDRLQNIFGGQKCIANYGILRQTKPSFWRPWRVITAKAANQTTTIGNRTFVNDIKWLVKKGDTIPKTPVTYDYTFEPNEKDVVHIVVSEDDKAKDFASSGRDRIAEVHCDPRKLAQVPRSTKRSCKVELIFSVGRFDVHCWSGENQELVGKYCGKFGKAFPGSQVEEGPVH